MGELNAASRAVVTSKEKGKSKEPPGVLRSLANEDWAQIPL